MPPPNDDVAARFRQWFTDAAVNEQAEDAAERQARLRKQTAEVQALAYLAEMQCPASVIEFGKRHGIEKFAEFVWQHGFSQPRNSAAPA